MTGQIAASNNEPSFGVDGVLTREVAENTGANVDVGAAVAATDDDTADTLYYWLTGERRVIHSLSIPAPVRSRPRTESPTTLKIGSSTTFP